MSDIPPEASMFEDEVRAPIMPKSETLVDDYDSPYLRQQRRPRPPRTGFENSPGNVFEMFRDFNRESRPVPSMI